MPRRFTSGSIALTLLAMIGLLPTASSAQEQSQTTAPAPAAEKGNEGKAGNERRCSPRPASA